jgi:hypothetical protein
MGGNILLNTVNLSQFSFETVMPEPKLFSNFSSNCNLWPVQITYGMNEKAANVHAPMLILKRFINTSRTY